MQAYATQIRCCWVAILDFQLESHHCFFHAKNKLQVKHAYIPHLIWRFTRFTLISAVFQSCQMNENLNEDREIVSVQMQYALWDN